MEIAESFFRELLFDTEPLEAVTRLDQFWCTHLDASDRNWLGLSEPEHHVHLCLIYTGEVGNGGHIQFFLNRGRDMTERALRALQATGLTTLHECLVAACLMFENGVVPADEAGIERAIDRFTEDQYEQLGALDHRAWAVRDADDILLGYLRKHQDDVLRAERGLAKR
jgi:hypothetical protein